MADVLGKSHWVDARVIGVHDGYEWARTANESAAATFSEKVLTDIVANLGEMDRQQDQRYSIGWAQGIQNYAAEVKRGDTPRQRARRAAQA